MISADVFQLWKEWGNGIFNIADSSVGLLFSPFALDFWQEKSALKHSSAQVRPHCKLVAEAEGARKTVRRAGGPTRIAFLGLSFAQKGWFEWRELSKAFGDTDGLLFFHFGTRTEENAYDRHVPVNVSPKNRSAMIDALLEHEIDVAFL